MGRRCYMTQAIPLSEPKPKKSQKPRLTERDFLSRHARTGIICFLINDTKLQGKILDWDQFNILLECKDRNFMLRKAAVRYFIAAGDGDSERLKPSMELEGRYLEKQIKEKQSLKFALNNGKTLSAVAVGSDTYCLVLEKDGREVLLLKHSYMYFYKDKEVQHVEQSQEGCE
jgi:sRNA-binding regulator protein Hfq